MASFAVVLVLMASMAAVAYTRLTDIERQAALIANEALPGLTYSNQMLVERIASYSRTQEFVLKTDMASRQQLRTAILASRALSGTSIVTVGITVNDTVLHAHVRRICENPRNAGPPQRPPTDAWSAKRPPRHPVRHRMARRLSGAYLPGTGVP